MRKLLNPLILFIFILLSACSASKEPEPTATTAAEPTEEIIVEPGAPPLAIEGSDVSCVAQTPAEDPLEESDWVEGLEKGYSVTIIEYGDYQ